MIADRSALTTLENDLPAASQEAILSQLAAWLRLDVAEGEASEHTLRSYLSNIKAFLNWCETQAVHPGQATYQERSAKKSY